MSGNIKYYKIKTIKRFLNSTAQARITLINELVVNATDPTLYRRRLRMLEQLSQYEQQIIKKLRDFDSDDPYDLEVATWNILQGLGHVVNKNA
jgi:hypothetical protein